MGKWILSNQSRWFCQFHLIDGFCNDSCLLEDGSDVIFISGDAITVEEIIADTCKFKSPFLNSRNMDSGINIVLSPPITVEE